MTPEERKAASVKRVARRQAQRAGAEFRSRTLLVTAQIAEHPTTHATNATGPGPGPGPGPVDGSAEDESASFARRNAEKGIADEDPADPAADLLDALRGDPLGVLNAHPVDDALGDPAGGAGSFAASTKTDTRAAEAERRRLEEERARSAHRRARMTAEEKQLQNQARHARRQRAKAAGLAGLEDPPGADPARVEGTLGGDDE
jgi:hypothetical protein